MNQWIARDKRVSVSVNHLLAILSDEHRRRILYHLLESGGMVSPNELADHLAKSTDRERQMIDGRLQHASLPKLRSAGAIVEDTESNQIIYTGGSMLTEMLNTLRNWETWC